MSDVETIAELVLDKTKWGDGPWQTEPDRIEWIDAGFSCLAVRNTMGTWCGYVAVPKEHPYYGKGYSDVDDNLNVHGGLTYADKCRGHICHIPKPGMPGDVWWFGFDCGHAWDFSPMTNAYRKEIGFSFLNDEVYRDADYIKKETTRLAQQLKRIMNKKGRK